MESPIQKRAKIENYDDGMLLPPDIFVRHILPKLDLFSYYSVRAVCSSWRSIAKRYPPPERALVLTMTSDPRSDARLHLLLDPCRLNADRFHCCGSWGSWVAIANNSGRLFLLNTIDRSLVNLPSQNTLRCCDIDRGRALFMTKVLLSSAPTSDGCDVVVLHICFALSSCRVGDDVWTPCVHFKLPKSKRLLVVDVAFFRSKLYILDHSMRLYTLDIPTGTAARLKVGHHHLRKCFLKYLLATREGELMLVLRDWDWDEKRTIGFQVCKLDEQNLVWRTMDDLNNRALLVNTACSLCIDPAEECPELEGNCIYFADKINRRSRTGVNAKVFRMADQSIRQIGDKFPQCLFLFHYMSSF